MKITINNHISLNELRDALSDKFKNYTISIQTNRIVIVTSELNFHIILSGKEVTLTRAADRGDVLLAFIPIIGWLGILGRNNISNNSQAKEILEFISNNYLLNTSSNSNDIKIPAICPNCKNPNIKKIRLCEWCGNQII
jgi:hypothetical protein